MILYQMLLDALVYEEQFSNYDGLGMGDASAYDERFWSFGDYGGDGDGGVRRVGMGVRVGVVMEGDSVEGRFSTFDRDGVRASVGWGWG